jgi:hypothetical protein
MFGSKIFAEVKAVGGLVFGLKGDFADFKLTWTAIQRDIADLKAALAEVRALTGHTATVTALAAQASVPTSVPVILPPAPTPTQGLAKDLAKDVAAVNPMAGVKLPGQ